MDWREEKIRAYFAAWVRGDGFRLEDWFAPDAIYTECYGPRYHGVEQLRRWIADWAPHGRVLEWTVKRVFSAGDQTAVEWYFRCRYDGEESGFDGATLITWDGGGRIKTLAEFESKAEHSFPYGG